MPTSVARSRLTRFSPIGDHLLVPPSDMATGQFAAGDWVLTDPTSHKAVA